MDTASVVAGVGIVMVGISGGYFIFRRRRNERKRAFVSWLGWTDVVFACCCTVGGLLIVGGLIIEISRLLTK